MATQLEPHDDRERPAAGSVVQRALRRSARSGERRDRRRGGDPAMPAATGRATPVGRYSSSWSRAARPRRRRRGQRTAARRTSPTAGRARAHDVRQRRAARPRTSLSACRPSSSAATSRMRLGSEHRDASRCTRRSPPTTDAWQRRTTSTRSPRCDARRHGLRETYTAGERAEGAEALEHIGRDLRVVARHRVRDAPALRARGPRRAGVDGDAPRTSRSCAAATSSPSRSGRRIEWIGHGRDPVRGRPDQAQGRLLGRRLDPAPGRAGAQERLSQASRSGSGSNGEPPLYQPGAAPHLEVQVAAARVAGVADVADQLAGAHALALVDERGRRAGACRRSRRRCCSPSMTR